MSEQLMTSQKVKPPTAAQVAELVRELRDPNDTSLRFKELAADWLEALESERALAVKGWERVTDDPVGSAERDVGRWVYQRISKLMDAKEGTPEAAELAWLAEVVESIEEYGSIHCAGEELATFPGAEPADVG